MANEEQARGQVTGELRMKKTQHMTTSRQVETTGCPKIVLMLVESVEKLGHFWGHHVAGCVCNINQN